MRMPPLLAKLFAGTALLGVAAPAITAEDNDDQGGGGQRPAGVSAADAERIQANAAAAVTLAVNETNARWATVLQAEIGEGDAKASILAQPVRLAAAVDLLADTDLEADKIIATISKPSFNVPAAPADANAIAAAAARERLRTTDQPDTRGANSGNDGTGANEETPAVRAAAAAKKTRTARNDRVKAQMASTGAAPATA